jgi:hypothetical protein
MWKKGRWKYKNAFRSLRTNGTFCSKRILEAVKNLAQKTGAQSDRQESTGHFNRVSHTDPVGVFKNLHVGIPTLDPEHFRHHSLFADADISHLVFSNGDTFGLYGDKALPYSHDSDRPGISLLLQPFRCY